MGRIVTDMEWKARSIRQWTATPCGTTGDEPDVGTAEFFARASQRRYTVEHPWLPPIAPWNHAQGLRVLEVGCGMGVDGAQFRAHGAEWVGLDLTPRHLDLARRHHLSAGIGEPTLVRGDAERLPFHDSSFDLVYSFGVLHHTPDTAGAVEELRRVLKPGGRAFVMLYHRYSLWAFWSQLRARLAGRAASLDELLATDVEVGATEIQPLVKAYRRAEARAMFGWFTTCRVRTRQLDWSGRLSRLLFGGNKLRHRLLSTLLWPLGFYLIIEARR